MVKRFSATKYLNLNGYLVPLLTKMLTKVSDEQQWLILLTRPKKNSKTVTFFTIMSPRPCAIKIIFLCYPGRSKQKWWGQAFIENFIWPFHNDFVVYIPEEFLHIHGSRQCLCRRKLWHRIRKRKRGFQEYHMIGSPWTRPCHFPAARR